MPWTVTDSNWVAKELAALPQMSFREFLLRTGTLHKDRWQAAFGGILPENAGPKHVLEALDQLEQGRWQEAWEMGIPNNASAAARNQLKASQNNVKKQLATACRAFGGREFPTPDFLGALLADIAERFIVERCVNRAHPPTAEYAKSAVLAWAYGPRGAGWPADEVVGELVGAAGLGLCNDLRAAERALVWGVSLPPAAVLAAAGAWHCRWPQAWETLFEMVRRQVYRAERWIGKFAKRLAGDALDAWACQEAGADAAALRYGLVYGCDCWTRWEDFSIESEQLAIWRCQNEHELAAWNWREMSLDRFVWRAAVKGDLRL